MKYKIIPRKVGKVDPTTKETKHQFLLEVGTSATGRKYITLPICESLELWDKHQSLFLIEEIDPLPAKAPKAVKEERKQRRAVNEYYEQINALIDEIKTKCRNIIMKHKLNNPNTPLTPTMFSDLYKVKPNQDKVAKCFEDSIESQRSVGRIGNANCYYRTLEMLRLFKRGFDKLTFDDINLSFVNRFDAWMQTERTSTYKYKNTSIERKRSGCSGNTRKYYHKALRAIINQAIKDGIYTGASYPYGKGGFEIGKLEEKTAKRYLSAEKMQAIRTTPLEDMRLEVVRRIFVCQYLCYGISWMDAGLLTHKNITNKEDKRYISYKRIKTKHAKDSKEIDINLREELQSHLDWFKTYCDVVDNYIFPIVSISGYTGEQLYEHIRSRFRRNNKILKNEIAPLFGIDGMKLTSYVTRHTVAMTLQNQKVPREMISEVLGHSDMKITNTYLDSFNTKVIDAATDNL